MRGNEVAAITLARKLVLGVVVVLAVAVPVGVGMRNAPRLRAQTQTSSSNGVAFEVASVKPNASGNSGGSLRPGPGGRIDAINMPLRMLIGFAYQLQPFRLVGGPSWITTARYDIVAKLPVNSTSGASGDRRDPLQDVREALRTLLADRFKLAVHQETREQDIYALVLARAGGRPSPSLKPSTQDCAAAAATARNNGAPPPPSAGDPVFCGMRQTAGRIQVGGMPLSQFANVLAGQGQIGRVVVDRTGLAGNWDFELAFAPAAPAAAAGLPPNNAAGVPLSDPDVPSIFTALQEQLGLKVESARAPVEVFVIDSVERPTPD